MAGRRYQREHSFGRGEMSAELAQRTTAQTLAALREMGQHVINAAKASLAEGAQLVVADAKRLCPVKTGKLRDSIKAVSKQGGAVYELQANARDDNGIAYGQFVEFSPKINRPFLYPAMDENRNIITNNIRDSIKEAIDRGS